MADTSLVTIPWISDKLTVSDDVKAKYLDLANLMSGKKDEFEGVGRAWRPAILKIVQPVTTDSAKPESAKTGDFFHKGGSPKRPLRGVLAYAWTSRARFVQGVDKVPSCRSENVDMRGRGSADTSVSIYGDACNKCPYGDQPFASGKPTNCNNVINTIFIPESLENIFQVQFSKSSYGVGRQLTDLARATPKAWSRFYEINTEVKKRDKGTGLYAVPTVNPVSDSQVPEHLKAFAEYVSGQIRTLREAEKTRVVARQQAVEDRVASLDTLKAERDYKDQI